MAKRGEGEALPNSEILPDYQIKKEGSHGGRKRWGRDVFTKLPNRKGKDGRKDSEEDGKIVRGPSTAPSFSGG
jgi:hypothetical protein